MVTDVNLVQNQAHVHTVHEGHKDNKCKFCEKTFKTPRNLKIQIKRNHDCFKNYK